MYSQPTGPRSIGEVLDDAIRLYRQSFRPILPLLIVSALLSVVPSLLIGTNSTYGTSQAARLSALMQLVSSPTYWVTMLIVWLASLVLYGALFGSIDRVAKGGQMRFGEAFQLGLSRLPRMLVAALLFGLALAIGFVLFIIPGIYLMGIYQLVFVALVVEDAGIFQSFSRSSGLIKGYWWRSTVIVTVAIVILFVISILVSTLIGFLAAMKLGLGTILVVNQAVSALLNIVIVGWLPCVLLAMYYDLKLRHEGQDLATRVDALAAR
jgi:hypothetical protein